MSLLWAFLDKGYPWEIHLKLYYLKLYYLHLIFWYLIIDISKEIWAMWRLFNFIISNRYLKIKEKYKYLSLEYLLKTSL